MAQSPVKEGDIKTTQNSPDTQLEPDQLRVNLEYRICLVALQNPCSLQPCNHNFHYSCHLKYTTTKFDRDSDTPYSTDSNCALVPAAHPLPIQDFHNVARQNQRTSTQELHSIKEDAVIGHLPTRGQFKNVLGQTEGVRDKHVVGSLPIPVARSKFIKDPFQKVYRSD